MAWVSALSCYGACRVQGLWLKAYSQGVQKCFGMKGQVRGRSRETTKTVLVCTYLHVIFFARPG